MSATPVWYKLYSGKRAQLLSVCSKILTRQNIHTSSTRGKPATSSSTNTPGQGMPRKLSVGIIGAGRIATSVHLRNILQHVRLDLKWIIENDVARQRFVRDELMLGDEFPFFTSSDRFKLLDDKSLDAVFVLTPVDTHTEYSCDALQRGKPVFVEKPTGVNYTDVKHGYDTAEKYQTPLLTGFMRRFDPAVEATVHAVQQGDIGNVHVMMLVTRDSPRPSYEYLTKCAKSGCNIYSDLCPHDIDLMVWLTKAERPESIYVTGHAHDPVMKECGEADTVTAVLKYRTGIMASIHNVLESVYGYDIRFEVFGSGGMAQMANPRLSSATLELSSGLRSPRLCTSFPDRFRTAFQNELQHFINCIDGTESPLITKEECLMTTEIVDRGIQSFKEGGVVRFQ